MSKYSIIVETVWTLVNIALFILNHYLSKVQDEYIKELEYQNKLLIRYAKWLTEAIRRSKYGSHINMEEVTKYINRRVDQVLRASHRCKEANKWSRY